jgi:peptidoglycan/LPS O-acetylase OafA/YrhL
LDLGFISALLNISLLQSWFAPNEIHFAFNSVSWSISSLAFFYMAFAFIQCNFKRCFLIACFISLLSLVLSGWYAACHHIDIAKTQWLLQIFPANRLAVFLFGMIFAKSHFRLCARFEHINIVPASILELLAILLVADRLSSCILINHLLKIVFTITGLSGQFALQIIDGYLFMPIMFGTLLLIFSMQQGIISMLLSKRPFVILGELSFAVYLFHQLVFRALSVLKAKTDMSTALSLALACTATMVLSYLIFRYVEQPSARGLKQVFEKDKHRTIVSPTPSVS